MWGLRRMASLQVWSVVCLTVALAGPAPAAEPELWTAAWSLATPGALPQAVVEDPRRPAVMYAALKQGGLGVYRLAAGAQAPSRLALIPTAQLGSLHVMHLALRDDVLVLALGDFFRGSGARAGLATVSIVRPEAPRVLGVWTSPELQRGAAIVAADARHAYLGAMSHGVMVFDISRPAQPTHVATFQPDVNFPRPNPNRVAHPNARGMWLDGGRLWLCYDAGGLRVLDVSAPARPREIGRYINPGMHGKQQAFNNLVLDGRTAYVAEDYAGMEVLDVSDPGSIRQLGWWNPWDAETPRNAWLNSPGHTNQLCYDTARRRVCLSAGDSELQVVDVSDPRRPRRVARVGGLKDNRGCWGVSAGRAGFYLTYIQSVVPFRSTWSGIELISPP